MEKCILCLGPSIIPIKLKSFKCYHPYHIHCNSFSRICIFCFLQKCDSIKKCFYCSAPKESSNFEIDHDIIKKDEFSIYTCQFCQNFKGTHSEIFRHVFSHHIYSCKCGEMIYNTREAISNHVNICSISEYCVKCGKDTLSCKHKQVQCRFCRVSLSKQKMMNHYISHIRESKVKIKVLKELLTEEKQHHVLLLQQIDSDYESLNLSSASLSILHSDIA